MEKAELNLIELYKQKEMEPKLINRLIKNTLRAV